MSNLTPWDPFREIMSLRREMDRLFDNTFFSRSPEWDRPTAWELALDVSEKDDELVVKASLPGVKPEDLEITYNDNVLTIKGETKVEEEKEDERYHLRERRYGTFMRRISLPGIKADDIQATYDSGVLTLHLPKVEEVKPRRIAIKAGGPQMIEAKASDIKHKN